jgi:hypothetical protein
LPEHKLNFNVTKSIPYQTRVEKIGDIILLKIPELLSKALPSRGLVMVSGKINNIEFKNALEPDGNKGHWLMIDQELFEKLKVKIGDKVNIEIATTKDWIEPKLPDDLRAALNKEKEVTKLWEAITPMARWEWIRWVNAAKQLTTRNKRIEVGIYKLKNGSKRPCCFNGTECTVNEVSKNGVLIDTSIFG